MKAITEIKDELAIMVDSIENTVDELNKNPTKDECYELAMEISMQLEKYGSLIKSLAKQ